MIAIVGISGRFPGADNVEKFWDNLVNGVDCVQEVPKNRWNIDDYFDTDKDAPNKVYSRYGGFLDDIDEFDPLFFKISPKEAESMDPQQRIFMQEAWKALEDAGYTEKELSGSRCGVFIGASSGDYSQELAKNALNNSADAFTGNSTAILPARISYVLNLIGPSMTIDTACSSSLVAIHKAVQSIQSGECTRAVAGGIRVMITSDLFIQSCKMKIISETGKCRTFDESADGIVLSEGVGVVILCKLSEAIKRRKHIYGVIRGSAINQDGKTNGITAPSALSQEKLETEVYTKFNINPENIGYIEAHGTATRLGDPIEVKALTQTFRKFTQEKQFCPIGSVKTNIGHATTAAGVISLIKVLMSFKHGIIPPTLHYNEANKMIDFENSPFFVNKESIPWSNKHKKMAAISSFGFSGTNCHMVVEEYSDEIL